LNAHAGADVTDDDLQALKHYVPEAAAILCVGSQLQRRELNVDVSLKVANLFGEHVSIEAGQKDFSLDGFLSRVQAHQTQVYC